MTKQVVQISQNIELTFDTASGGLPDFNEILGNIIQRRHQGRPGTTLPMTLSNGDQVTLRMLPRGFQVPGVATAAAGAAFPPANPASAQSGPAAAGTVASAASASSTSSSPSSQAAEAPSAPAGEIAAQPVTVALASKISVGRPLRFCKP